MIIPGRGKWWSHDPDRKRSLYGPFTVMHAEPGGGPVLKGDASFWRTASGFLLFHPRVGHLVVMLRHHSRWGL